LSDFTGSLIQADATNSSCESELLPATGDSSHIKMFDIQLSANDALRKQGIYVDGSQVRANTFCRKHPTSSPQTMLQKIIWNNDECLLNLQHLSLSSRYFGLQ
jgi:hypothetical protein